MNKSIAYLFLILGVMMAYGSSAFAATPAKPNIAWMADPTTSNFDVTWDMWWWENGSTAKLEENGSIITTVDVPVNSPQAQKWKFSLTGKTNGSYVYRVFLCNGSDCKMSDAKTVRVNIATSAPVLPNSTPTTTTTTTSTATPATSQNTLTLSEDTKRMIRTSTAVPGIPTVDLATPSNNAVNVARVMRLFPESKWNEIFPVKKSIYTYPELLKAIAKFPLFCNDRAPDSDMDLDTACKTELATVFAHMVQETGGHSPSGYLPDNLGTTYPEWKQGLYYIREVYCTTLGTGCEYRGETCNLDNYFWKIWPCPVGASYYGRWAHQLSYNFNYAQFSQVVFGDASVLLNDPDRVAREGWLAMSSAIWFYMTPSSPKPSMHDVMVGYWKPNSADIASGNQAGFGATTNIINGGIECGKGVESAGSLNRISYFKAMTLAIGGKLGSFLECGWATLFPAKGSAVVPSYFEQSWDGSQTCQIVTWQTGFSIFITGSYQRCVEHYFNVTPTSIPDLLGNVATPAPVSSPVLVKPTVAPIATPPLPSPVTTVESSVAPNTPTLVTNTTSPALTTERKIAIIINLGTGLRLTPSNFSNSTTFRQNYSYESRSIEEKQVLDNFWEMLTKKRTGVTKLKTRALISNLSTGLTVNKDAFLTRVLYDKTYGYINKSIALQSVLDDFWIITH